ncbi:MAG TPA: BNR-4 repeat-containing protein [Phycisphaerae bacterium]|nr:BNR-4 repeat-containing protein [Phycisphaerae bacterium]HOJ73175.1 BNR-4 repeat-containing protein [Phycisphaerae bacterium]HOM52172.1 BNR-4 repeat-containing protein [Phycisphaerae bacterium]HON68383.1 BNR-4 repeat-containing protein [Phycisphaerae bacterium]HOQ85328.1 BNR-4 repeat-containing protein [Phycisphaerae bacterium]
MDRIALSTLVALVFAVPVSRADEAAAPAPQPEATASRPTETAPAAEQPAVRTFVPVPHPVARETGYRGFWLGAAGPEAQSGDPIVGGVAFAPMSHAPVAVYAAAVDKTFFVYAGASGPPAAERDKQTMRILIGAYDHKAGTVSVPVILLDNLPPQAYGCPALTIDDAGRLWVFAAVNGADYPSTILRSAQPHDIDAWEKVAEMDFQHPQAWHVPGQGFLLVHTRQIDGKPRVHSTTSPDGLTWSEPTVVATFGDGQSCLSGRHKNKIGIVMTQRPMGLPAGHREDVYYLETPDLGRAWQALPRKKLELPLADATNPARVKDYKNWHFILNDLTFDRSGNPIIVTVIRHMSKSEPAHNSRIWATTRWTGREWEAIGGFQTDSDHDAGCLEVDKTVWLITAPARPGPQPASPGGEIVRLRSEDQGRAWYPHPLTENSSVNHNWVRRPVDAQPAMSLLWADGNPRQPSESHLYFADTPGNVYRLPTTMTEPEARPELVHKAPEPATQPDEDVAGN